MPLAFSMQPTTPSLSPGSTAWSRSPKGSTSMSGSPRSTRCSSDEAQGDPTAFRMAWASPTDALHQGPVGLDLVLALWPRHDLRMVRPRRRRHIRASSNRQSPASLVLALRRDRQPRASRSRPREDLGVSYTLSPLVLERIADERQRHEDCKADGTYK